MIAIDGIEDHIHILIHKTIPDGLVQTVRSIKANSSRFIRENFVKEFTWQKGYSVFTENRFTFYKIKNYILNQEEHHKKMSSEEEYTLIMKKLNNKF